MTYREALTEAMTELGRDPLTRFIGYGIAVGNGANGTLTGVPLAQRIETPVSEALMMGMAVGMSLRGLRPLVYCERMDFLPLMLDQITNQLDSIGRLSRGQFKPAVIIRVMVGSKGKPPFTALTHTRCFPQAVRQMVTFPVVECKTPEDVLGDYRFAHKMLVEDNQSTMLIDFRELF